MDQEPDGRRPTKLVLAAAGLFLLAVFLGRLLVAGGVAWALLALALPAVLFGLAAALGLRAAAVLTGLFVAGVLAVRWLLVQNPGGWIALLLVPVVALTALVVGRVLAQMRRRPGTEQHP